MSEVTSENVSPTRATPTEATKDQSFITKERETYQILSGTNNEGVEYEIRMIAYFSLMFALSNDINDFRMSTNNAAYPKFDDIVAEILRDGAWKTFAMQLKHSQNQKKIKIDKYSEAKNLPGNPTCILFTNSSIDTSKVKMSTALNISDLSQIEQIELCRYFNTSQQLEQNSSQPERLNIHKKNKHPEEEGEIYFFTEQQDCDKIQQSIAKLFEGNFHLDSPASTQIADNFLKFITVWKNNVFGNCKLDKEDIKTKIFELVFWDHIYKFNSEHPKLEEQNFQLLKGVCNLSDITIIKTVEDEFLLSNLINPDFKKYQEHPDIKKNRKSCLLIPENCPKISERQLYYIMWRTGQIPLILNTANVKKQTLYDTLKFASIHRVILYGSDVDVTDLQGFKIFHTLSDLKSIDPKTYEELAKQFMLSLQGREPIKLDQFKTYVGEQETDSSITVEHLLIMATKYLQVGSKDNFNNLPPQYVSRQISRNVVSAKEVSRIKNCAVLIDCKGYNIREIQEQIVGISMDDDYVSVDDYLQGKGQNFEIILADQSSTQDQWSKVIQRTQDAIHLKAIGDMTFEFIVHASNSIDTLQKYATVKNFVDEDKIFDVFDNKFNVVCAEPGMGKSTFTAHLATTCPPHFWVKRIECRQHNRFFENECKVEEALKHFSQDNQDALERLCMNRMKLLYIFDGLDEIDFQNVDNAVKCMKVMSDAGIKIWVSARHNLQERLEKGLRLLSMDIQEFSEEIQKTYIRDRLKDTYSNDEIDIVLEQVFVNTHLIQNKEILGVPLQLYMLTQILIDDKQFFRDISQKAFVLTKMYHSFFEGKFKHYCQKMQIREESLIIDKQSLHQEYEQQAIMSTLSADIREHLPINVEHISQKYQRDRHNHLLGITVNVQNEIPVFTHHTYAEYFTACWLVDNFNRIEEEKRRFLFEDKYQNLRILFDMKLSEELPLHLAVLYKDIGGVHKYTDQINERDLFGRTALHIARCSGIKVMNVSSSHKDFFRFERTSKEYKTKNKNSKVKELMKYLVQSSNESTLEEDKLFRFTSIQYADFNLSLCLLEEISEKYPSKIDLHQLHNFGDLSTVLCYAAYLGYTSLLQVGFNFVNNNFLKALMKRSFLKVSQKTLLYLAIAGDNIDSAKLLSDKGASINQVNKYSLLRRTDVFQLRKDGRSPLTYAILKANPEICRMLIDSGADVNQMDKHGYSPLIQANRGTNLEICRMLIDSGADVNQVNKSGDSPIICASREANLEICRMLIDSGADVNQVNKSGDSPIICASREANLEICRMLIDSGADVNQVNKSGDSPIICASREANLEICRMLIDSGADVNQVNKSGDSPIICASREANLEICRMLIDSGADVNQVNKSGDSPLICATGKANYEICRMLIDGGADVNQVNKSGDSPIICASREANLEICRMLIDSGADVNHVDKYEGSPLIHAIRGTNLEICGMLIDSGANVNQVNKYGDSPLIHASRGANLEICRMLIDSAADVNQVDKSRDSPLIHASRGANLEICRMLIASGADVNQVNKYGDSPLINAILGTNLEICRMLIDRGANVNQVNKYGYSPLIHASRGANLEICRMLIASGADVNQVNKSGYSPLIHASRGANLEICRMLIASGADVNQVNKYGDSPLINASHGANLEICRMLIASGADVNQVNKYGDSPLINASHGANLEICRMLIASGADVNQVNKYLDSPLIIASHGANLEICRMLIASGADVNQVNKSGYSPLIHASRGANLEICRMLIDSGANVNQVDKSGDSPIICASREANLEICRMLIDSGANVNQVNKYENTPLSYLSEEANPEIFKMLIDNGAVADVKYSRWRQLEKWVINRLRKFF